MLSLSGVTKQIGGLTAVNELTLLSTRTRLSALLGRMVRVRQRFNIISGILPLTAGKISFCGEDITGMKADRICRKGIAKTFQIAESFPNLSAQQCVMIVSCPANTHAPGMREAQAQAQEILGDVNFPREKDRNPHP